jgi:predicted GNAT family acetyltransferase
VAEGSTEAAADVSIRDVPERARYELRLGEDVAGFAEYRRSGDTIVFQHTVIEPEFEGRGLGSKLARHVLDEARAAGLTVRPHCPFIASYIADHSEYADLVQRTSPPRG